RKMCLIGLGKIEGAFEYHRAARRIGFEAMLLEVSGEILSRLPNIYGLGLIEDGYHQLAHIEELRGAEFAEREPALFAMADEWMPRLPFKEVDVLIVDEIGKNISGAGMDPNVTGRDIHGIPRPDRRTIINTIFVRDLTPESHGNAIGLGYADLVTARLVAKMNKQITYTNSLSSMTPASVRIPMHYETEKECLAAAVRMSGQTAAAARLVQIRNTLALNRLVVSEHYAEEIAARSDLTVLERLKSWEIGE
ncbi:MAG: [Fe-S]-binding protein, partial [Acidobacteriota bacterium]